MFFSQAQSGDILISHDKAEVFTIRVNMTYCYLKNIIKT